MTFTHIDKYSNGVPTIGRQQEMKIAETTIGKRQTYKQQDIAVRPCGGRSLLSNLVQGGSKVDLLLYDNCLDNLLTVDGSE